MKKSNGFKLLTRVSAAAVVWVAALLACLPLKNLKEMFASWEQFVNCVKCVPVFVYGWVNSWPVRCWESLAKRKMQVDWNTQMGTILFYSLWVFCLAVTATAICQRRKMGFVLAALGLAVVLGLCAEGCHADFTALEGNP